MLTTSRKTLAWFGLGILASVALLAPVSTVGQTVRPSTLVAPGDSQPQFSEQGKDLIRLEEIYRQQVRETLTRPSSRYGKALEVLNAPFILWLLSSVALSAGTGLYARHRSRREKEKAQSDNVRRLVTDLSIRVLNAKIELDIWDGKMEGKSSEWSNVKKPDGAFADFKDRDMLSLAVELTLLRPDDAIAKELTEACKALVPEPADAKNAQQILKRVADLIDKEERLTRR